MLDVPISKMEKGEIENSNFPPAKTYIYIVMIRIERS
jgi:hypothetical protein